MSPWSPARTASRSARLTDNAAPQVRYSGWTARRFIHRGPFIRPIRGTWAYDGTTGSWLEAVGGDGGNSGISVGKTANRMHTYYSPAPDVNFDRNNPLSWDWVEA
jgi:hypothetical protein